MPPSAASLGQMLLDFFALAPPTPTAPAKDPISPAIDTPLGKTIAPKKRASQAGFTPKIPQNTPKNTAEDAWLLAMSSSLHQHPQATHRITLQGQSLGYKLVRSRRRSVGFVIGRLGLEVRAAPRVSLTQIATLLHERSDWILRHLASAQDRAEQQPEQKWADGASCALHGHSMTLRLNRALTPNSAPNWPLHLPQKDAQLQDGCLQLPLPLTASAAQIERAVLDWYGRYAHAYFVQRLAHYAPIVGVRWTQLKLSNANTRWGSAKRDGSIRLHWRLVQLAPELLDYVVVHELAHLHEMNHSPRFWAIVAQHCPNYLALRKQLKSTHL